MTPQISNKAMNYWGKHQQMTAINNALEEKENRGTYLYSNRDHGCRPHGLMQKGPRPAKTKALGEKGNEAPN